MAHSLPVGQIPGVTGISLGGTNMTAPGGDAFAHLIQSSVDPLVVYAPDWRILYLNDAGAAQMAHFGERAALIGKSLFELVPDLSGTTFEREMRRAMTERVRTIFTELRKSSGHWAEVRCEPLPDGNLAAIWRDVTEQRRAERTLNCLAHASTILTASLDHDATLQALASLVVPEIADWCSVSVLEEGRIRQVAVAHTDPSKVQLVRRFDARYPSDPAGDTRTAQVIRTGESDFLPDITDAMIDRTIPDPEYREMVRSLGFSSVLTVPLRGGGRTLGSMSLVMIDGRRMNEGDIVLAKELARRAAIAVDHARLYREALAARTAAEDANASKVEFLARMSHELRTPLNAIGGFADLLVMGVRGSLSPQQLEDVRRIQRNQTHLLSLISDILNYAKLEVGRLEFDIQSVPARGAVHAIEQIYSGQFSMRDLTWACDFDPPDLWVLADADKLQQILMNLVGNALKFTPAGGRLTVTGRARGDHVEIRVADTGVGIPTEKLELIFDPFVQVARPGELSVGTGLGLAIARDLARGMRGELWAEPNEAGATFALRLPKSSPAAMKTTRSVLR